MSQPVRTTTPNGGSVSLPMYVDAAPQVERQPGLWYCPRGGATSSLLLIANRLYLQRFTVHRKRTPAALGFYVSTAGSAGAVVRVGIATDVNGVAGSLVTDLGATAAVTSAAIVSVANLAELPVGNYWLGCVGQGSPTTQPTLRATSVADPDVGLHVLSNFGIAGHYIDGITGALPSTFGATTDSGTTPALYVKP